MSDVDRIPTLDLGPNHEVLERRQEPLRVPLTHEEHRLKGAELAARLAALADMRLDHADIKREMKEKEKAIEAEIASLRLDVQQQQETRPVDVEDVADYRKGIVETYRVDTGKIVRSRGLKDDERQRSL